VSYALRHSRVAVRRFLGFWARRRFLQPPPQPEKAVDHYADAQQHQHHDNGSAHILNGDRSKPGG
jgi:hypothetical protein